MKQIALFLAIMMLPISASRAQTTQPSLKLIPSPRQIELNDGRFTFGAPTTVGISNENDVFAAAQLIEETERDLNITLRTGRIASAQIVLSRSAQSPAPSGVAEAYSLLVSPEKIEIRASSAAGIFYGVQRLKQ